MEEKILTGYCRALDQSRMVVAELERCILVAEEENIRLGKVYRGCGVLLGVFIMIILI